MKNFIVTAHVFCHGTEERFTGTQSFTVNKRSELDSLVAKFVRGKAMKNGMVVKRFNILSCTEVHCKC